MKNLTPNNLYFTCFIFFIVMAFQASIAVAGLGIPRSKVCHGPSAAKTVAMNRIWDTSCGTFGKITGKVCSKSNPYPNFDKLWKFCVVCHFDNNCEEYWGDPHIRTRDGLKYDFQLTGDYALIESDQLNMQVRFYGSSRISYVYGVAIKSGNTKIEIDYLNGANYIPLIKLNENIITLENGDWYDLEKIGDFIQRMGNGYRVELNGLVSLGIRGQNLRVNLDDQFNGNIKGMLSDSDSNPMNDLLTANESIVDPSDKTKTGDLYTHYADDWRRSGELSLFSVPLPEGEPFEASPLLSELDESVVESATLECIDAGVEPNKGLSECIYDLSVTGDSTLIEQANMISPTITNSISAAALSTTDVSIFTLGDTGSVSPNLPSDGAGTLSGPTNIDEYSVSIPIGQSRVLAMSLPCPLINTLKVLLLKESAPVKQLALNCETVTNISEEIDAIRVFSDYGELTDYSFELLAPTIGDLGDISLGREITGSVGRGEVLTGNLLVEPASLIYARSKTVQPCAGTWQIIDSIGSALSHEALLCENLGILTVTGVAPYTLKVTGVGDNQPFSLEVLDANEALVSLEAPSTISAGKNFTVRWTGPANERDFIALARVDQSNGNEYESFKYLMNESNEVILTAPGVQGNYEIRYVQRNGYEILSRKAISVGEVSATLNGLQEADAGSQITIQWTGPQNERDFISLARIDQLNGGQYETYKYVSDDTDNVTLTVPGIPGEYEIRYVLRSDYQIIARQSLTVRDVTASLIAPPRVEAGTQIAVQWIGPSNDRDFITLARTDQLNGGQYETYKYVKGDSNQVVMTVPGIPGDYEIRYVLNSDYQIIARNLLTVDEANANLTLDSSVDAGSQLVVNWAGPANDRDFISLARINQVNGGQYQTYKYVTNESDEVTLTVPGVPGDYEVRYVLHSDYQIISRESLTVNAVSATLNAPLTIEAESQITVHWAGPANERDFIALSRVDDLNGNQYETYQYVNDESDEVSLNVPSIPGVYELRYVLHSDYQIIARKLLTVEPL